MRTYIFNHTENNPLVIDDYPYGFRLRTQIRYWIETTPKKGDRFCSQTLNPKNNRWNAPKKSTYSCLGVMFKDEKGHIHWSGVSIYDAGQKTATFIESIGGKEKLNDTQMKMYFQLMGINPKVEDEFTGKVKKDFSVKWEVETTGQGWGRNEAGDRVWNKGEKGKCREVKITFDRPDGVKVKEIFLAMKSLNQERLNEVFEMRYSESFGNYTGTVRICTRGGNQLATVREEDYREFLAMDINVLEEENY